MGSFNPYPGSEIKPEINQQENISQEINAQEEPLIIRLSNSIYYFIQCVFIMKLKHKYRLVALHHSKVLHDKYYQTLKGCQIAFSRRFKNKAWKENTKPHWSLDYTPEHDWLEDKYRLLET